MYYYELWRVLQMPHTHTPIYNTPIEHHFCVFYFYHLITANGNSVTEVCSIINTCYRNQMNSKAKSKLTTKKNEFRVFLIDDSSSKCAVIKSMWKIWTKTETFNFPSWSIVMAMNYHIDKIYHINFHLNFGKKLACKQIFAHQNNVFDMRITVWKAALNAIMSVFLFFCSSHFANISIWKLSGLFMMAS